MRVKPLIACIWSGYQGKSLTCVPFIRVHKNFTSMASAGNTFLIVGLGNHTHPRTRHSIGMSVVDALADKLGVTWTRHAKAQALIAHKHLDAYAQSGLGDSSPSMASSDAAVSILLMKSKQLMNICGKSVAKIANEYAITASHVYLIHDDLQKPVGKFTIKESGSALGHNGVRSVHASLRSDEMPRLRIGIDRPSSQAAVMDYVLSPFDAGERTVIGASTGDMLRMLLTHIERKSDIQKGTLVQRIVQHHRKES